MATIGSSSHGPRPNAEHMQPHGKGEKTPNNWKPASPSVVYLLNQETKQPNLEDEEEAAQSPSYLDTESSDDEHGSSKKTRHVHVKTVSGGMSLSDRYQDKMNKLNEKMSTMEQPSSKVQDWHLVKVVVTIVCFIGFCWPCTFLCLAAAWVASDMVKKHNQIKDYMSARTCSWVTLCCLITSVVIASLFILIIIILVAVIESQKEQDNNNSAFTG